MLKVVNVNKNINDRPVLSNINFEVPFGSITGLIGENGAGKTTLLKILSGILRSTSGESTFCEKNIFMEEDIRQDIIFVSEETEFFKYARLKDMISFYKSIYTNFDENFFHEMNEKFCISLDSKIQKLSKGTRMKASLMLGLASKPRLLLLDEPTTGLDPQSRKDLFSLLVGSVADKSLSIIISSHLLHDLEHICDHVIILKNGKILNYESIDSLKSTIHQFQICFKEKISPEIFNNPKFLKTNIIGRVAYVTAMGNIENTVSEIESMDILFWEMVDMKLEDIFITKNEVGEKNDSLHEASTF